MLSPKRVKFRKMFKGRTTGTAHRGSEISFGTYGLMALEPGWISRCRTQGGRRDDGHMPPRSRILVRRPSPRLANGELTHVRRVPVDADLALHQWSG